MQPEPVIGIDLGTTFSLVAFVDERGAHVVRDANGDGRVPSVFAIAAPAAGAPSDSAPRVLIGWAARQHAVENPQATVHSIKRLIGRSYSEIQSELPFLGYAVDRGPRESVQVEIDGRRFAPQEISAMILREMKSRAEAALGQPVRRAVITVPAYFDDAQRQATRDAAHAAGLEAMRIINEPTAAALAYGIGLRGAVATAESDQGPTEFSAKSRALPLPHCQQALPEPIERGLASTPHVQTVAVFDLGGGTFDVSILRIDNGVFQVLATAGDTHLGGDDFDRRIIACVQAEIQQQFDRPIESPITRQALRTLAEATKIRLSEQLEARLELEITPQQVYRRAFTRAEYESLVADLVERAIALMRQALRDAGLQAAALNEIVLVGGATRTPLIRRRVKEEFGKTPYTAINPDEVVAIGAAVQAALLSGAARRNDDHSGLPDLLLLDVTPLSLGIETLGGAVGKLILRNSTIPCRATEVFTTFVDGQTAIQVNVLQGERELARDCRSLATFELRGIPPMPAGIPKVQVEFLIDANGILNVAATETRSGVSASIQVVPNHGLTREEVERITRDAITFGRADLEAHRRIDLLNQVQFDTLKTEQMLSRVGRFLSAEERDRVERDMIALRALANETSDLDELHRALNSFGRSTLRLAELGIREALRT